jgi:hypothetical protein
MFETPIIEKNNFPFWKINHELDYSITDNLLNSRAFVEFLIKDINKKEIGNVKIDLHLIANGPYHNDI